MMLSRYKVIDKLNTTQYLTIEEREELLDLLEQAEDKTIYYNLYVLLQARIDKAIEYIKVCNNNDMGIRYQRIEEILRGSDK